MNANVLFRVMNSCYSSVIGLLMTCYCTKSALNFGTFEGSNEK
jgi:hypothetical protein